MGKKKRKKRSKRKNATQNELKLLAGNISSQSAKETNNLHLNIEEKELEGN